MIEFNFINYRLQIVVTKLDDTGRASVTLDDKNGQACKLILSPENANTLGSLLEGMNKPYPKFRR
ncbi:hypothetical protein LCGC14_0535620 [marine sediment metagenome]|uniref:Uncharacterized protein n=1 Tax=marine sediment metagenome TaxID=412755 RepID=A0A0F9V2I5_9ZZZZ